MSSKNDPFKPTDTKEVDSLLQSEIEKVLHNYPSKKVTQEILLDSLELNPIFEPITTLIDRNLDSVEHIIHRNQTTRRRASSVSSTKSSTTSPVHHAIESFSGDYETSPIVVSICPICHKKSSYETVVTWKDCHHKMMSIPHLTI